MRSMTVSEILYRLQARGVDLPHYEAPSGSAVSFETGRRQNMDRGVYGPNKEKTFW